LAKPRSGNFFSRQARLELLSQVLVGKTISRSVTRLLLYSEPMFILKALYCLGDVAKLLGGAAMPRVPDERGHFSPLSVYSCHVWTPSKTARSQSRRLGVGSPRPYAADVAGSLQEWRLRQAKDALSPRGRRSAPRSALCELPHTKNPTML